jgi:hypothetical protein
MKLVWYIIGVILFFSGTIFILQGTGVYPVGGMANQVQWVYIGAVMDVVGIVLVVANRRRKSPPPAPKP